VGSIPIARSITNDSIVLTPLDKLNTAIKLGVFVPCWSQPNELVPMCLGDPGAKFLCGKLAIGTKKEKRSKKKARPVGTVGGNESSTGGTNGLEERMPEGSPVSRFLGICWEFHHR